MKFKINLKPYPGEPYFTVREHLGKLDAKVSPFLLMEQLEDSLRRLFRIPARLQFAVFPISQKKHIISEMQSCVLLDDPSTGKRKSQQKEQAHVRTELLDLTYSLPFLPEVTEESSQFLIDPNASLGVPSECFFIFSKAALQVEDNLKETVMQAHLKDHLLMKAVLKDMLERDSELGIRECNYKAAVLYQLIESRPELKAVQDKQERSKTCVSALCNPEFKTTIEQLGYEFAVRDRGETVQITIANYLTHSKESIEMFADRVAAL